MDAPRRIVLATDFSEASKNALEHAAFIAERHGAELHAVFVSVREPAGDDLLASFPEREQYEAALQRVAAEALDAVAPRFELPSHHGGRVSLAQLLADGRPAVVMFYRGYW